MTLSPVRRLDWPFTRQTSRASPGSSRLVLPQRRACVWSNGCRCRPSATATHHRHVKIFVVCAPHAVTHPPPTHPASRHAPGSNCTLVRAGSGRAVTAEPAGRLAATEADRPRTSRGRAVVHSGGAGSGTPRARRADPAFCPSPLTPPQELSSRRTPPAVARPSSGAPAFQAAVQPRMRASARGRRLAGLRPLFL